MNGVQSVSVDHQIMEAGVLIFDLNVLVMLGYGCWASYQKALLLVAQ